MKFIHVDNCLIDYSGHSGNLAISLLKADKELIVLSHKHCILLENNRILSTFSLSFAAQELSLPDVSESWSNKIIAAWRLFYANAIYFRDLYSQKQHWCNAQEQVVMLIANSESRCVFAVILLALLYRQQKFVFYLQRGAQKIFWLVGLIIRLLHLQNVRFIAETSEMADKWTEIIGIKCTNFPFPVEPQNCAISHTSVSDSKITFGILGPPRKEKGFNLILKAYQQITLENCGDLMNFIIQVAPVWSNCEVDNEVEEFRKLATQSSNIQLIENVLSHEEYTALWSKIDVILLPYSSSAYSLRSSGVLMEAIANAKPVITTANTLLACMADKYAASIKIEEDSEYLVIALKEAKSNFSKLNAKSRIKADEWKNVFSSS